jgi:hypothetical protein
MRSRRVVRRGGPRKRPIWVNIPFAGVAFTEVFGQQLLMVGEDWEAQFTGISWEHAVLRAIVGEINIVQTAAGTAGGTGYWGIYIQDNNSTVVPAFTVAGMSEVDWLRTGCVATQSAVTQSLVATRQLTIPIAVKAKRRLTSRDTVFIGAQYGADAASPGGSIGGILRFLVSRD